MCIVIVVAICLSYVCPLFAIVLSVCMAHCVHCVDVFSARLLLLAPGRRGVDPTEICLNNNYLNDMISEIRNS